MFSVSGVISTPEEVTDEVLDEAMDEVVDEVMDEAVRSFGIDAQGSLELDITVGQETLKAASTAGTEVHGSFFLETWLLRA